MNRSFIRVLRVSVAILALSALAFLLAVYLAPGSSAPGTAEIAAAATHDATPGASPGAGANGEADDGADDEEGEGSPLVAFLVLLFGAFALLVMYDYLNRWRHDVGQWLTMAFAAGGRFPVVTWGPERPGDPHIRDATGELTVTGPSALIVGERSQPFAATLGDQQVEANWTVRPSTAATVDPESGKSTQVTATKEGQLTLTAQYPGAQSKDVVLPAIRAAAPTSPGSIPVIGYAYGGITIAIVAVAVAAAITALGLLDGAALATLLGTVVSYFFAQRHEGSSNGTGGGGGGSGAAPSGTPGGSNGGSTGGSGGSGGTTGGSGGGGGAGGTTGGAGGSGGTTGGAGGTGLNGGDTPP